MTTISFIVKIDDKVSLNALQNANLQLNTVE